MLYILIVTVLPLKMPPQRGQRQKYEATRAKPYGRPKTPEPEPDFALIDCKKLWDSDCWAVLLQDQATLDKYYAEAFERVDSFEEIESGRGYKATPKLINTATFDVAYDPEYMTWVDTTSASKKCRDFFRKKVDYLSDQVRPDLFSDFADSCTWAEIMEDDIRYNEIVRKYPHPNLATYYGVEVGYNLYVKSLLFKKYTCDLHQFVNSGAKFDPEDVMRQLEAGVKHLHDNLGFVHMDLKPPNVVVDASSSPIRVAICDFDSMHMIGQLQERKGGTPGWSDEALAHGAACPEMDFYGLRMIRHWLKHKGWGNPSPELADNLGFYRPTLHILSNANLEEEVDEEEVEQQGEVEENEDEEIGYKEYEIVETDEEDEEEEE